MTTFDAVVATGGGAKGEVRVARGGVDLRSVFFDTGEEEAGGEWVSGFGVAAFFQREDVVEACFFYRKRGP